MTNAATLALTENCIGNSILKPGYPSLCFSFHVIVQVNTNTPESVFQLLAYLKKLLIFVHQNYILPALASISDLLQRAWSNLQDSCKSVLKAALDYFCFSESVKKKSNTENTLGHVNTNTFVFLKLESWLLLASSTQR